MHTEIEKLEPQALWSHFVALNNVPRASKKEEEVIQFMMDFGASLNLEVIKDSVGNVIIKKPASPGMEDRATIALQSHLDMVHQKNADTVFDFATQGIQMFIDEDWVRAKGTTLGADNGIGVATIMALLSSTDIEHPPLEALFTIDEETGMTGAMGLKSGLLKAEILLNLDTEDDDELTIGCAGGVDVTATGTYEHILIGDDWAAYEVKISGLTGGHSGMDIHKGRGNANKLMNRFLFVLNQEYQIRIQRIDGGGLRNAIPRESKATFFIENSNKKHLEAFHKSFSATVQKEHNTTDANLSIELDKIEVGKNALDITFQNKLLRAIYACPSGIYRMSPDIPDLVQTSNNLARVLVDDGSYEILCLTRSSVDSEKMDEAYAIESAFELLDAKVSFSGSYPGWAPKPNAAIVKIMSNLYEQMFKAKANVSACHAGLECGILGEPYPEMDMISFGPNIRGAHSPDECVQISSVRKFWSLLLEALIRMPLKGK